MIEAAYTTAEALGIQVWCEDEAGPYQTVPYPGHEWAAEQYPKTFPHEYIRNGTAKLLTLFHPATGLVRIQGTTESTNAATLHRWLKAQLTDILSKCPLLMPDADELVSNRAFWESWRAGLSVKVTLSQTLPRLRLLLIMDNLVGYKNPEWLRWCFSHGVLPLYTL